MLAFSWWGWSTCCKWRRIDSFARSSPCWQLWSGQGAHTGWQQSGRGRPYRKHSPAGYWTHLLVSSRFLLLNVPFLIVDVVIHRQGIEMHRRISSQERGRSKPVGTWTKISRKSNYAKVGPRWVDWTLTLNLLIKFLPCFIKPSVSQNRKKQ